MAGIAGLLLGLMLGFQSLQVQQEIKRAEARDLAFGRAQQLTQRLQEAVGPAYMLASLVQRNNGRIDNFEAVAAELLQQFPMARAIELAPGGIITQVYPLPGNEMVIGHDLLRDRSRNREAHLAVSRKQLTLAGPFELRQGGLGAVGRFPVFQFTADGRQEFWGFSIVLLRVPELLSTAGFVHLTNGGYVYELCRIPPDEEECKVFMREGQGGIEDPVTVDVDVPNARWRLSVAPEGGWVSPFDWVVVAFYGLVVAVLLGCLQATLLRRFLRVAQAAKADVNSEPS